MVWSFSVFTLFGLIAAVLCGTLAIYAWEHRDAPRARSFFALLVVLAVWALVYGMQLGVEHRTLHLILQGLTLGIAAFVPTIWVMFAVEYLSFDVRLTRRRKAALLTEPVVFAALALSNGIHGTVWQEAGFQSTGLGVIPVLSFGPLYYVHIAYAYALVTVGVVILGWRIVRPTAHRRPEHALVMLAVIPPFVSHISFTMEVSPITGLDFTPFVFAVTALIFGFAIFRFALLDRSTLARERALAEMGDGVVVLDEHGEVVDLNGIAKRVLGPTIAAGEDIASAFDVSEPTELDGRLIEDGSREFDLRVWPLFDDRDQTVGYTLVFRDVTDLRTYQQQLEVSSRVLRHNLRNGMTVIAGHARTLEQAAGDGQADRARTIRDRAEELMETAEKARRMTSSVTPTRREETSVDVVGLIAECRERIAASYPDVEFSLSGPEAMFVRTENREALAIAVENVLENAAEHNGAADPQVTIGVEERQGEVIVEFVDNGSGIPDIELDALDRGRETPVRHGEGLGLWLAYWGARASGGRISFASEPSGTEVTFVYPTSSDGAERPAPAG